MPRVPFIIPPRPPVAQRRTPRPLTKQEQERVAQQKLERLVAQFAKPARPDKPKKVAIVATFHDEHVGGSVDWDKQSRKFDQVRNGGKRKNPDGRKRG